jgi:hypothetical protein
LYEGENIPSAIPLQAAQRSTAGLFANQNERLYSYDTLHELCGCLISITEEEDDYFRLSFAHYTVRQYLDSKRIFEELSSLLCRLQTQFNAFFPGNRPSGGLLHKTKSAM